MYCKYCGKEVENENHSFCMNCGKPLKGEASNEENIDIEKMLGQALKRSKKLMNTVVNAANSKEMSLSLQKSYIFMLLMLILSFIMAVFTKNLQVESMGYEEGENLFKAISSALDNSTLTIIFVIIYIFSILVTGYNFLHNKDISFKILLLNMQTSGITITLFGLVSILGEKISGWGAELGLSFSGIILILSSVINFVFLLTVFLIKDSDKNRNQYRIPNREYSQSKKAYEFNVEDDDVYV